MNDQIVLHQDEDGNYTVDVVGLMYLLKTKALPDGSIVSIIFEDDEEETYYVTTGKRTSFLVHAETSALFEIYPRALEAVYYIDVEIGEMLALNSNQIEIKQQYEQIHYEEALTRMKNGETVYLDFGKTAEIKKMDSSDSLTADMVIEGTWFTSPEIKGKKNPALRNKTSEIDMPSLDSLFDRLETFLEEEEKKERKLKKASKNGEKKDKKKDKKKSAAKGDLEMEDLLDYLLTEEFVKALEADGFDIEIVDLDDLDDLDDFDFEDYI